MLLVKQEPYKETDLTSILIILLFLLRRIISSLNPLILLRRFSPFSCRFALWVSGNRVATYFVFFEIIHMICQYAKKGGDDGDEG